MSNDNRLPVSDDIIDRILLFSPTFSSLKATILTCKSFYHVFQTHPKSIVRAVASNITGPALPQALECIRHPDIAKCSHRFRPPTHWGESDEEDEDEEDGGGGGGGGSEHSSDDDDDDDDSARAKRLESVVQEANEQRSRSEENNTRPVGDDTGDILSAPITIEETYKILANAKVVARLEDLFSFRYINRSFSTSQLSATESRDFRVAVYHFMLYSSIFHPGTWNLSSDSEDNDDNDNDNDNDNANRTTANAVAKNREMLEKRKRFLSRFSTPDLLQMHSVAEFLKEILSWCVRASGYPPEICDIALAAGPARIIQCYNNQNEGLAPLEDILDFFEEELEFHPMVAGYLSLPLEKNLKLRGVKAPPSDFTHWYSISGRAEESNSQCTRCHRSFDFELFTRSKNLWVWLRQVKANSAPLAENCWYGYNCRTQTHNLAHAQKLNHLCEQTRF
ncbi:hypothetical protein LENED_002703 [Lentinula edodes]|uniref:Uncharacterized protein n=1 Tax=Lentinula edodes TaxID=5353 RepID=A0A1Q3E1Y5_LENED|nr:hypothetical protein LENED_002703 [Lentinula edodes]